MHEKEVIIERKWQFALELAGFGLNDDVSGIMHFLHEEVDLLRSYAWELARGDFINPSKGQVERIVEACKPLISARIEQGEIDESIISELPDCFTFSNEQEPRPTELWKYALKMAGFDFEEEPKEISSWLHAEVGLIRSYAFEIAYGLYDHPSPEQIQTIVEKCRPKIQERLDRGEIQIEDLEPMSLLQSGE